MEKAFEVKVSSDNPFEITRQDVHMWLLEKQRIGRTYNRINWTYVPSPSYTSVTLVENGTQYYPVEYLAPYLNAIVNYDKTTKELTATYKGIKIHETIPTEQKMNEIKGYVYTPDGKPAQGVQMRCYIGAWDKTEPFYTETDANGFYTFGEIDTIKYPEISVQAYGVDGSNPKMKNYFGEMGKYLAKGDVFNISDTKAKRPRSSRLVVFPDINMIDESIWDK